MFPRRVARNKFVKDLTRTRHMTAVSAVVLVTTFMPLLGLPDIDELRAFQSAIDGVAEARAHALAPRRDDEAARERSANSVTGERNDPRTDSVSSQAERVLTVQRPDRVPAEPLDAADILPLPPVDEPAFAAPLEQEEPALPEVEEEAEPLPGLEDEPAWVDEEPAIEDEELY